MTRSNPLASHPVPARLLAPALALATLVLLATLPIAPAAAQDTATGYQMPPQVLADMIDAPPTPGVALSPDKAWLLLLERPGLPPIAEVAEPELRLAGLRINPRTNGPSREWSLDGLTLQRLRDGKQIPVTGLPEGARITGVSWSPDGERFAWVANVDESLSLWYADLDDGRARRVTPEGVRLNAVYGRPYDWLRDSESFVIRAVPAGRGEPPVEPYVPSGPVVQQNLGKKAPARTLQDLLQNPYDEELYEYYTRSQVHVVDLDGETRAISEPSLVRGMDPSPDGRYLMLQNVHRPYSYSLQEGSFPRRVEIWDLEDNKLVHLVADLPLQDQVPMAFGSVPTCPRSVQWRSDAAAELVWTEALDGGDGGAEAEYRDQVYTLAAPFTGQPEPLIKLEQRYGGMMFGHDELAFVVSWWWTTRNLRVWHVAPGDRDTEPRIVQERSFQDRYADPGQPLMHRGKYGRQVMLTSDGGHVLYLRGDGASPEGDRPFLDRWDVRTDETERLFRSEAPYYENPVDLLDDDGRYLMTRRESQTEVPNYFVRDLRDGDLEQKTDFPDPTPQLAGMSKELITYERADGVQLSGTLYLPPGYDQERDGPLPVLMWAYPNEFKSAQDAGQVTDSPYRFTRVGWWSPVLFVTRGYAVLDDPTMPIIGEGEVEPNDTFVEQLVSSAKAAVDELVRRGVGDPDRMAVGGHSYGAFMTANLLAHSDLFRTGLPRSGAYNRTLTPFGFQAEERSLWEAPEIYMTMSPFMHAEKIDEPILLVHGDADNNSGTYPMQSERMYDALKGHGATARLVMLPHESHSYRARESIMHLLWETDRWLEEYVKNAEVRTLSPTETTGS
jgi:dipeptidyl aminopeptidase/acylaminoacyl peptidase